MADGGDGERQDPRDLRSGLSRRAFLRGGAAASLGAGLLRGVTPPPSAPAAKAKAEAGVTLVGPLAVPMSFHVNGQPFSAKLEPRVTLLDALRNQLDLTGAKKVCDRGTCGACTVILGGKAVYACSVLAIEAQEMEIETVEGLGKLEKLHPLQAAFVEHDAQQCGFCTSGFLMAVKALLAVNPTPSVPELHHGLSGNFCRCGTYAGMRRAVLSLAKADAAEEDAGGMPADPDHPGAPGDDQAPGPGKKRKNKKHKRRNWQKRGPSHD
jgi:xanthine dehydrogenase YagT iron-sulfur-binding subunit